MWWFIIVAMLVQNMDNSNYVKREQATRKLIQLNNNYDLRAFIVPYTFGNNEIAFRTQKVIDVYNQPRSTLPCLYHLPKITSYPFNDPDWKKVFQQNHPTITEYDGCCLNYPRTEWSDVDDKSKREYTKILIADWLKKYPRKQVILRLDIMATMEYFGYQHYPEPPCLVSYKPNVIPMQMPGLLIRCMLDKP